MGWEDEGRWGGRSAPALLHPSICVASAPPFPSGPGFSKQKRKVLGLNFFTVPFSADILSHQGSLSLPPSLSLSLCYKSWHAEMEVPPQGPHFLVASSTFFVKTSPLDH